MTTSRKVSRLATAIVALGFGLVGIACASHTGRPESGSNRNTITEAEIEAAHAATAYDAIHRLRPQFLIGRGQVELDPRRVTTATTLPRVYVDDQFYGDVSTLRGIVTGTIESIRYYSGSAAQYKYGHDNAVGVIAIATKH